MKRKHKIALLSLVFALLCSFCAVFAGAEAKTVDSGLYDGTTDLPSGSFNYTRVNNEYYKLSDGASYLEFTYAVADAFQGGYGYLTAQVDFRAEESVAGQKTQIFIMAKTAANGWPGTANLLNPTVAQATEGTNGTLTFGNQSVTFENVTEWHRLELVVKLPYTENGTFHDVSEAQVFLDGKQVITKIGGILGSDAAQITGMRLQKPSGVTASNFGYDNIRLTTWASGEYARAEVNGVGYLDINEAFANAGDGDTVTLHENMTEAVTISKNLTVETNGKTFLYRKDDLYTVSVEDTTYRFAKEENPATIEIVVDGEVVDTLRYAPGVVPGILSAADYLYHDGGSLIHNAVFTASLDGVTLENFGEITEDMRGKTVRLTVTGDAVAFTVTGADGTVEYTTDSSFATLQNTIAFVPTGSTVTLYRDYEASGNLLFNGWSNNKTTSASFDLNGHAVTQTNGGVTGTISARCELYLYSSRKGGSVSTATGLRGTLLSGAGWGKTMFVGTASDGRTFPKENLSFSGANLYVAGNGNAALDLRNVSYLATFGDSYSLIQAGYGTSAIKMTIDGCDLIENTDNKKPLFGASAGSANGGSCDITITNTNIFTQSGSLINANYAPAADATDVKTSTFTLTLGKGTVLIANKNLKLTTSQDTTEAKVILQSGVKLSNLQETEGVSLADASAKAVRLAPVTVSLGGVDDTVSYLITSDYATLTFRDGETVTEELWAKGEVPVKENVSLADGYYKTFGKLDVVDDDRTYDAKVLSSVSKIKGNLTLYSSVTMNFYLAKDSLAKTVKFADGKVVDLSTLDVVTIAGNEYYVYHSAQKAPKDLISAFTIEIGLGDVGTYTVKSSLVKYAASVLSNASESEEGKTLVKALVDYVRETALHFGVDASDAGMTAIGNLLAKYPYTRATWSAKDIQTVTAGNVFKSAALNLDSTPGFLFFVADDFTGEITVKYGDTVKVYTSRDIKQYETVDGAKSAIRVDLHASEYRELITLTAGDETMTYNLDTYLQSMAAPAYLQALYAYSVAAEAYLAAQQTEN